MFEFLIPGVEHTEEADLGAEMFGIASDFEEGCGSKRWYRSFLFCKASGASSWGRVKTTWT
jgi:hypothetical protein